MPLALPPLTRARRLPAAIVTAIVVSVLYLLSMHIHLVQTTPLQPTALDRAVPFLDWTIWIYYSYAVFLFLPFAVCRDEEQAARACYRLIANAMLASLIFLVWPTSGVVQQPAVGGTSGLLWSALLAVDRPANYFPSLHVANTCICAVAIGRERGAWRRVALVWAPLIVVSTATTKQHFVIDLPGGVALAACAVWLVHRFVRVI